MLLLEQSIDEVLEKHYDTPDIEFLTLVDCKTLSINHIKVQIFDDN